ncbi:hypothetical protein H4Q26_016276 [Puccinia striiformis f. sp. tritici PST-130]|nr:hypothetical protein H4Q26_016276 [Puccinia striiformis f. sp. tritici PST-130]
MSIDARQSNASLDLSGKTAVVTGATQGIGKERGNAVLERLRAVANERADSKQQFEFIKADLSTIKTIKQTASEIQKKVGTNGLDYLLMTQGGPPNGFMKKIRKGRYEKSLVVHCLSRFGLSYLLAEAKTLKKESTVVSILSPGSSYSDIDLEDLSLKKLHETDPWRATMLMSQGKRDSTLTDAFTLVGRHEHTAQPFFAPNFNLV